MKWLGRILSEAWRCYWSEFPNIATALLLIWLPIEWVTSYQTYFVYGGAVAAQVEINYRLMEMFIGVISDGAIVSIVLASLLGNRTDPREAISISVSSRGRLAIGRVLAGLIILAGLILFIVPGLYCFAKLSFLDQIIINENRSSLQSIRRSFELTCGKVPKIIAIHVVYVFLGAVGYFSGSLAADIFSTHEHWFAEALLSLIYDFMEAFGIVCLTLAYADLAAQDALNAELFVPASQDGSFSEDHGMHESEPDGHDERLEP